MDKRKSKFCLSKRVEEYHIIKTTDTDTSNSDDEYLSICELINKKALKRCKKLEDKNQLECALQKFGTLFNKYDNLRISSSSEKEEQNVEQDLISSLNKKNSSNQILNALPSNRSKSFKKSIGKNKSIQSIQYNDPTRFTYLHTNNNIDEINEFNTINTLKKTMNYKRRQSQLPPERFNTLVNDSPYLSPLSPRNNFQKRIANQERKATFIGKYGKTRSYCEVNTQTSNKSSQYNKKDRLSSSIDVSKPKNKSKISFKNSTSSYKNPSISNNLNYNNASIIMDKNSLTDENNSSDASDEFSELENVRREPCEIKNITENSIYARKDSLKNDYFKSNNKIENLSTIESNNQNSIIDEFISGTSLNFSNLSSSNILPDHTESNKKDTFTKINSNHEEEYLKSKSILNYTSNSKNSVPYTNDKDKEINDNLNEFSNFSINFNKDSENSNNKNKLNEESNSNLNEKSNQNLNNTLNFSKYSDEESNQNLSEILINNNNLDNESNQDLNELLNTNNKLDEKSNQDLSEILITNNNLEEESDKNLNENCNISNIFNKKISSILKDDFFTENNSILDNSQNNETLGKDKETFSNNSSKRTNNFNNDTYLNKEINSINNITFKEKFSNESDYNSNHNNDNNDISIGTNFSNISEILSEVNNVQNHTYNINPNSLGNNSYDENSSSDNLSDDINNTNLTSNSEIKENSVIDDLLASENLTSHNLSTINNISVEFENFHKDFSIKKLNDIEDKEINKNNRLSKKKSVKQSKSIKSQQVKQNYDDKNLLDKTPTIIYPDSMEIVDDSQIRRSRRIRVKPLEFWRNQKLKYKVDAETNCYAIDGVEKGFQPDDPFIKKRVVQIKRKLKPIVNKEERLVLNNESEDEVKVQEADAKKFKFSLNDDFSIHADVNESMLIQSEKIKKEATEFYSKSDLVWNSSKQNNGVYMALMNRKKDPVKGTQASGFMKLTSFTEKPRQLSGNYISKYVVMFGAVSVQIADKPSVFLKYMDSFKVNKQTWYSIRNLRKDEALLYFDVSHVQ